MINKIGEIQTDLIKMARKSILASKVLKLMDKDYSYSKALKKVLDENRKKTKKKLEKNLNQYI